MENVRDNHIETVAKLVRKVKKGDKAAFQLLYENTWKPVYYMLLKKTGNEKDAEILLNEVYIKVFVGIGKLKNSKAFYSWVTIVANHTYLEFLRKNGKKELEDLCGENEDFDVTIDYDEEFIPDMALEKKENRALIIKIINELPKKQREVIYMFYYLNMKAREIAESTNSTENTVTKRLHDARKGLKSKLSDLVQKGVITYNMAGFIVLRELFHEDMNYCINNDTGAIVWSKVSANSAVIASIKISKTLAMRSFALKFSASVAAIGLTTTAILHNLGVNNEPKASSAIINIYNKKHSRGYIAEQSDTQANIIENHTTQQNISVQADIALSNNEEHAMQTTPSAFENQPESSQSIITINEEKTALDIPNQTERVQIETSQIEIPKAESRACKFLELLTNPRTQALKML